MGFLVVDSFVGIAVQHTRREELRGCRHMGIVMNKPFDDEDIREVPNPFAPDDSDPFADSSSEEQAYQDATAVGLLEVHIFNFRWAIAGVLQRQDYENFRNAFQRIMAYEGGLADALGRLIGAYAELWCAEFFRDILSAHRAVFRDGHVIGTPNADGLNRLSDLLFERGATLSLLSRRLDRKVSEKQASPPQPPVPAETPKKRFRIGLSFSGQQRPYIEQVADLLANHYGKDRILYDNYHKPELARPGLDDYLPKLYRDETELSVIFISASYGERDWCGLEMRAIRDLLKRRQFKGLVLFRFDMTPIEGIYDIDGYIEIKDTPPAVTVEQICERYNNSF